MTYRQESISACISKKALNACSKTFFAYIQFLQAIKYALESHEIHVLLLLHAVNFFILLLVLEELLCIHLLLSILL